MTLRPMATQGGREVSAVFVAIRGRVPVGSAGQGAAPLRGLRCRRGTWSPCESALTDKQQYLFELNAAFY